MATVATNKTYVLCHESTARSHGSSSLALQENVIRPQSSECQESFFSAQNTPPWTPSALQQNQSCDKTH